MIDVIGRTDAGWARHDFYMRIALVVESGAKCLGSQVGAALVRDDRVLGSGYNGTPSGYPNCTPRERGCHRCAVRFEDEGAGLHGKLYDICLCVHAEQNAMATAARFGVAVDGSILYSTLQPCFNCLKNAMQTGVHGIVFRRRWQPAHPDYVWVATEYDRLIEHFRSRGHLVAQLEAAAEGEASAQPVEAEIGRPI
jgi:dCMP deaminase